MKTLSAQTVDRAFFSLLREWCDALCALQSDAPDPSLSGGILCPACKTIHGRCHEAVYPLLYTAERTGDVKYLTAAKKLFAWGENMRCADGSMRNDRTSGWKGVTVFAAVALHDALFFHGDLLDASERQQWQTRLSGMGEWLHGNITVGSAAYINYYAANACAMALLGKYFDRPAYLAAARILADYCFAHESENGLLYGEGRPHDARTAKGCLPIDLGYNAEESLPSLTRYAETFGDADALERCRRLWRAQLRWMLPDGAWDDSFGTRSFKWTYWGSRTADGCQDALLRLGRDDPAFADAAWQNCTLLQKCTHGGLLAGGPDYAAAGEPCCVHHTFCHAKALAAALDAGTYDFVLPDAAADNKAAAKYYPELDTYRTACGGYIADVAGYDARYKRGGHVSGGAVSLLWHRQRGAVIAAGMAEYALLEPNNQQLPQNADAHISPCPRIEAQIGGKTAAQIHDFGAQMHLETADDAVTIHVRASLCGLDTATLPDSGCTLTYTLRADGLTIEGSVPPALAGNAHYILPVVRGTAEVMPLRGRLCGNVRDGFCLTPGFCLRETTIAPDKDGRFAVKVTV
ncbi:MAG: hypothetical protein IJT41_09285 [Clostridia bacterium]|nr:hypothetical protein [Clostridia bacterium]